MVKSMTAYGRAVFADELHSVSVELKSVNSRYFDCNVRLPRAYLFLEEKIKAYLQKNVTSRGKVDVFVTIEDKSRAATITPDLELAKNYANALREVAEACGLKESVTLSQIARHPDLFATAAPEIDADATWNLLLPVLSEAGAAFKATAEAEGERIQADISEKMEKITAFAKEAEQISQANIGGYRDKLESRIRQMLSDNKISIDEQRILTECAIMADKLAVDEELVRLGVHRKAFFDILAEGSPCGKKLDFLLQECNRETNTLGSKGNDAGIAGLVINMKNELEKIREQIQNIE